MNETNLIIMLTKNDETIPDAESIFKKNSDCDIDFWGIKTKPLSKDQMKSFVNAVHEKDKIAVFESITYTENDGLDDAKLALECDADILMGTIYSDPIRDFCEENEILYMPFIGKPNSIPSVLDGTWQDLVHDIDISLENNCFGVDFLAYRHTGDQNKIIQNVFECALETNICVAGSIDSEDKLKNILSYNPTFITIGTAFFENKFGDSFQNQIKNVKKILSNLAR